MNPYDVAKTDAESCRYGLDVLGIGKERSNDFCTMLSHLILDCGWSLYWWELCAVMQKQF